jgi:hypothetical protein
MCGDGNCGFYAVLSQMVEMFSGTALSRDQGDAIRAAREFVNKFLSLVVVHKIVEHLNALKSRSESRWVDQKTADLKEINPGLSKAESELAESGRFWCNSSVFSALANILQRPIVVLTIDILKGNETGGAAGAMRKTCKLFPTQSEKHVDISEGNNNGTLSTLRASQDQINCVENMIGNIENKHNITAMDLIKAVCSNKNTIVLFAENGNSESGINHFRALQMIDNTKLLSLDELVNYMKSIIAPTM